MLDLSRTPNEVKRDAAALLRDIWQTWPKTKPNPITEPEEDPDER